MTLDAILDYLRQLAAEAAQRERALEAELARTRGQRETAEQLAAWLVAQASAPPSPAPEQEKTP